ncbi:MAG: hypothetical protein M5U34_42810 [Chloroflexi bacterium]|nr:hypothetical protein [Chloroflexota bacterium]
MAHTRQKRVYRNGRWQNQTVTEWRWEKGQAAVAFDDLLINGSQHLSQHLLKQIKNLRHSRVNAV